MTEKTERLQFGYIDVENDAVTMLLAQGAAPNQDWALESLKAADTIIIQRLPVEERLTKWAVKWIVPMTLDEARIYRARQAAQINGPVLVPAAPIPSTSHSSSDREAT